MDMRRLTRSIEAVSSDERRTLLGEVVIQEAKLQRPETLSSTAMGVPLLSVTTKSVAETEKASSASELF